jgi:hypothetical protein
MSKVLQVYLHQIMWMYFRVYMILKIGR